MIVYVTSINATMEDIMNEDENKLDTVRKNIIEAVDLTKEYGKKNRSQQIESKNRSGRNIRFFLGPNGAGKITTAHILTTLLKPTSGRIIIDGFEIPEQETEARKILGIVQQQISLDKDISVREI